MGSAEQKYTVPLSDGPDWTFDLIEQYEYHIDRIAKDFRLDIYPNQIEVITAEQMMDAYASIGMPINYTHWSFGKKFIQTEQQYRRGQMGLAYEIVINSNPCIAYLMEENTITMQALVMAHACYGHNSFFKGNYLFQTWTDADSIIDYLVFAKNYISKCEQKLCWLLALIPGSIACTKLPVLDVQRRVRVLAAAEHLASALGM